jgi:hypothetical protein
MSAAIPWLLVFLIHEYRESHFNTVGDHISSLG